MTDAPGAADALALITDLREETTRLRDPTALRFVGGDAVADATAADALSAQVDAVPELREQVPTLATAAGLPDDEVARIVDDYADAARAALERVRSGRAPASGPATASETSPVPDTAADPAAIDPRPRGATAGSAEPGTRATTPAEPRAPSLALPALVAIMVLAVAVVALLVLL